MKVLIGSILLVVSSTAVSSSTALAANQRAPEALASQYYTVSPQSYASQAGIRGSVATAQQEMALLLWKTNRRLSADDIERVGQQVAQQFRVAEAGARGGLLWTEGASQK